ncbi:MAG: ribosome-binding factor A, partial [Clostridia bacterium]|nr:ribosome-binding factor A [Clostridia bacterium]
FIRGQIAQRLNLRITPELQFVYDDSIAYGAKISTILHKPSVREDIRRFDERAEQEALEAAAAAAEAAEEDEFDD